MLRLILALCLCAFVQAGALPVAAAVDPHGAVMMRSGQEPRLATVRPAAQMRPVTLAQQTGAPGTRFTPQAGEDGAETGPGDAVTATSAEGQMRWLRVNAAPVTAIGSFFLVAILVFLLIFRVVRGRVRIEAGRSGRSVPRYSLAERTVHWLMAGSFAVLGVTGLFLSLGREFLVPALDEALYGTLVRAAEWLHKGVWWVFALSLVALFVLFVRHAIPLARDVRWWRRGGALYRKGVQLDAGKFDGGQKVVFWATVLLGGFVTATGVAMLFPFRVDLFAGLVWLLNVTGIPTLLGGPLDAGFSPQEELQLAQLWHAILSFALIVVALAHSYMRSLGMEGAAEAMYSGTVDENFARERSNRWAEKQTARADIEPSPPR